jgi:uncharacterized protein YqiB (DUF1249 family)
MAYFQASRVRPNPIGLFEENYRLLQALLPEPSEGESRFRMASARGGPLLQIHIQQRCPYTTILELAMPFDAGSLHLPDLHMQLRLYHDARVAEVAAYQGCGRLPAPYQVNRHAPFLVDEKRQINLLLHELLHYCQRRDFQLMIEHDCS